MNVIKQRENIELIYQKLIDHGIQYALLFKISLHSPISVSKLVEINKNNAQIILSEDYKVIIYYMNQQIEVCVNEGEKIIIEEYLKSSDFYLFMNTRNNNHLDRSQFYRVFQSCSVKLGLNISGCNEVLKKTYAYHRFLNEQSIQKLSRDLNKTYIDMLKYIEMW